MTNIQKILFKKEFIKMNECLNTLLKVKSKKLIELHVIFRYKNVYCTYRCVFRCFCYIFYILTDKSGIIRILFEFKE